MTEIRETLRAELKNELTVSGGETIRISVRFPSGARFDKIFGLDDSLEVCLPPEILELYAIDINFLEALQIGFGS